MREPVAIAIEGESLMLKKGVIGIPAMQCMNGVEGRVDIEPRSKHLLVGIPATGPAQGPKALGVPEGGREVIGLDTGDFRSQVDGCFFSPPTLDLELDTTPLPLPLPMLPRTKGVSELALRMHGVSHIMPLATGGLICIFARHIIPIL